LENYKQALQINEKFTEALVNIALVYFNLESYNLALTYIDQALLVEPKNLENLYIKGDILTEMDAYDDATKIYLEILIQEPENTEIYFDLAGLYWNQEMRTEAYAILDQGIGYSKNNYKNYLRYAEFEYEMGNISLCINYLSLAINLNKEESLLMILTLTQLNLHPEIAEFLSEFKS
jgi:tetratricopeptide (TPR) repeat protein